LADRPRILVLASPEATSEPLLNSLAEVAEVVRAKNVAEGLARLRAENLDGLMVSTHAGKNWQEVSTLLQTEALLEGLGDGLAALQPDFRILWANPAFEKWCGGPVQGQMFLAALGNPTNLGPDYAPLHTALQGKTASTRLNRSDGQYLDLKVTPILDPAGNVRQLLALCRDITPEVRRQQKLDALHQAGRELAALSPDQLSEMTIDERVEILKQNIRQHMHDLLHYDVIEIRLLDRETSRLVPLLAEGMTAEAASRVLYANVEGNGVTGYVAATGKSYVCNDTATDPHYLEGAKGARSSLTVALSWGDGVIGTFNVESPQVGGFGAQDVQFAEIFGRELANALHTLELLLVEKRTTASQSIEAVSHAVALPVDEILTAATALLDRWIGHEPEIVDKLKKIVNNARAVKQSILKVGQDLTPEAKPLTFHGLDAPCRLQGMRVLVVDNDDRVRRSAHFLLGRLGCTVETARDGQEAITLAKNSNYDAMLADIRLPDLPGYEVFRALREAQPKARVILMTGYGYDPTHAIVKARQEGLAFVLYKPFRVEQMVSALESPEPTVPIASSLPA
jgi:CheY-like chemotaxis protein